MRSRSPCTCDRGSLSSEDQRVHNPSFEGRCGREQGHSDAKGRGIPPREKTGLQPTRTFLALTGAHSSKRLGKTKLNKASGVKPRTMCRPSRSFLSQGLRTEERPPPPRSRHPVTYDGDVSRKCERRQMSNLPARNQSARSLFLSPG